MTSAFNFSGWRFLSDFAIPGAVAIASGLEPAADIVVTAGSVPPLRPTVRGHPVWQALAERQSLLDLPGIARFLISDGRHVTVEPALAADRHTIGFLLGGPVLAVLLRQRGLLPVDGAALGWAGGALVLAGPSGQGKSLLAAALAQRGWPVLGDGVLAVDPAGACLTRSWPRLRLWPCGARALGLDLAECPPLRPGVARVDTLWPGASPLPMALRGIVTVLNRAPAARCEPLSPARAAVALAQSVWSRPAYADGLVGRAALMQDAVRLAQVLPCWLLTPAQGLDQIGASADHLLAVISQPAAR